MTYKIGIPLQDFVLYRIPQSLHKNHNPRREIIKACILSPPVSFWNFSLPGGLKTNQFIDNESYVQLIKYLLMNSHSAQPQNNSSFATLVKAHKNLLILAKFYTFQDIAAMLNGFLTKFLNNALWVQFLTNNTKSIMQQFMKDIFWKTSDEVGSQYQLIVIAVGGFSKHWPKADVKCPAILCSRSFTDA